MSTAPAVPCQNHARRAAIGLCVGCRGRLCGECSTKIEGAHYCVECLPTGATPGSSEAPTKPPPGGLGRALSALALGLTLLGLAWAYLEVVLPG